MITDSVFVTFSIKRKDSTNILWCSIENGECNVYDMLCQHDPSMIHNNPRCADSWRERDIKRRETKKNIEEIRYIIIYALWQGLEETDVFTRYRHV